MPTLIDTLADQAAELDELAEDNLARYGARVRELIANPSERNGDVWELYDADVDLGIADFALVPRVARRADWTERFASLLLAAKMQAFVEIIARPLLAIAERHGDLADKQAGRMPLAALRQAAKDGISKDAVSAAARDRLAARSLEAQRDAGRELL